MKKRIMTALLLSPLLWACGAEEAAGTDAGDASAPAEISESAVDVAPEGAPWDDVPGPEHDAGADAGETEAVEDETEAPVTPHPPPRVGLMHTEAQLRFTAAHLDQEPWQSAFEQLLGDARTALGEVPSPLADFHVPAYYQDEEGHEAAKQNLAGDAYAAYALALAGQLTGNEDDRRTYAEKSIELLDAWAFTNVEVSGADGDLVMMYKGVMLLYAADLLWNHDAWPRDHRERFSGWVQAVFARSAEEIKDDDNNHGDWGTLGAMAAAALLENRGAVQVEIDRIKARIDGNIDAFGELPEENLRTNSGMWYTYFALASMTAAVQIALNTTGENLYDYVSPRGRSIRLALDRHFYYCLYPDRWPYEPPGGLAGILYRLLYPCADEVEIPTPGSWPGNLFEIMSHVYGEAGWESWVEGYRPVKGWQAWIYPTLMRGGL